jgi:quinol monooxygenase YgiN
MRSKIMIHVVAILTAKPGKRDAVLAEFKKNMPAVLQEDGCIQYTPVIDLAGTADSLDRIGPDAFMVLEKWASHEALQAHAASAHMAAYGARVKEFLHARLVYALSEV